jgi:hypothetical protein
LWYETEVPMHIVRLIERRFPNHKASITTTLACLSVSLLLLGIGLMLVR